MSESSSNATYLEMLRNGKDSSRASKGLPEYKLAILADSAVQQFTFVLTSALREVGYNPTIWSADYGTSAQQALDRNSELYRFNAKSVYLSIAVQQYRERFYSERTAAGRDSLPESYLGEVLTMVDAIVEAGCDVIVTNLALPVERMFGNYGFLTKQSVYGNVLKYNSLLADSIAVRKGVLCHDVMYLCAGAGTSEFLEERAWSAAKYNCATRFLPEVARSLAALISAKAGRFTKVIVLDLDNTLWGGVIGDDGIEGISLGGDALGESFQRFQRYLLSLKQRGYVLAVCSKNDAPTAIRVFREHREMLIKEDDIAVFVANWENKADNIISIANKLNLGLDSIVFIDDSAFERGLVRAALPMVKVPELPDDVAEFAETLEKSGVFEGTDFTEEDSRRNQYYRDELSRADQKVNYSTIDGFLISLKMHMSWGPFHGEDIPRVAQLFQRSNQFNLRTQRLSDVACEQYSSTGVTASFRLSDRFGDYGMIAAVCCDYDSTQLNIVELVMSCRVLKRGVEEFIMNFLFSECLRRALSGIRGEFIRTPKNSMVKDFYRSFGFEEIESDENRQVWYLDAASYVPRHTFIK